MIKFSLADCPEYDIFGRKSIVADGSLVTKDTVVKSGSGCTGIPARKTEDINPELLEGKINRVANSYCMYTECYNDIVRFYQLPFPSKTNSVLFSHYLYYISIFLFTLFDLFYLHQYF